MGSRRGIYIGDGSGFYFCKIQKASQVLSVIDRMEFYGNLEQKYFLQCL